MPPRLAACLTCFVLAAVIVWRMPVAPTDDTQAGLVQCVLLGPATWNEFQVGGKEADAIYGDIVLRNRFVQLVIAAPRGDRHANMTVRDVAGAVIDFADRGRANDQLQAFYPGRRQTAYRTWQVLSARGQPLAVTDQQPLDAEEIVVSVRADGDDSRPAVTTEYRLSRNARCVMVTTRARNDTSKPLSFAAEDDLRADGQKEWMDRTSNGPAERFVLQDRYWQQAYGVSISDGESPNGDLVDPARVLTVDGTGSTSRLKFQRGPNDGSGDGSLPPGAERVWSRRLWTAANQPTLITWMEHESRSAGQPLAAAPQSPVALVLHVTDQQSQPLPDAEVTVRRGELSLGVLRCDGLGKVPVMLSPGEYAIEVGWWGRTVLPLATIQVNDQARDTVIRVSGLDSGLLQLVSHSTNGEPCPAKWIITPADGQPILEFGPETASAAVKNLIYSVSGSARVAVPMGEYRVQASLGPEFNVYQESAHVKPGQTTNVKARLERVVETTGWVSADFHSHSSPSGDNTSSQLGRVANLICEHVEYAPCTEHNRVDSYLTGLDTLNARRQLGTVSGIELTGSPLPLNHFNAFPLILKPHEQDQGAPVPGSTPEEQIERLLLWDQRSDKLIQQNHPDVGWLVFDRDGNGEPDGPTGRTFPGMDVMELHPIEDIWMLAQELPASPRLRASRYASWLQLLNLGYQIMGVVNTDAHYNFHGSGWLRNWIQLPDSNPAEIAAVDVVHAARGGRLLMSNGPFIEFTASALEPGQFQTQPRRVTAAPEKPGQVSCGGELRAPSGRVRLTVRLSSQDWMRADRLVVLVNGRYRRDLAWTVDDHPELAGNGSNRLWLEADVELTEDAHLIVIGGNPLADLKAVYGEQYGAVPPSAITNPIFVDVDGNGFQPSGDLLDRPLPVKLPDSR